MNMMTWTEFSPIHVHRAVTFDNMDGLRDYHIKWPSFCQEQVRYHLYVESKKRIQMNFFTKQKQTHRHRKQIYGYQRRKGGGTS